MVEPTLGADFLEEVENVLFGVIVEHFDEFFFFDVARVGNVEEFEEDFGSLLYRLFLGNCCRLKKLIETKY